MDTVTNIVQMLNGIFFSSTTVYVLLATGLVFTIMSGFGQYRALTHGVAVVRGKYNDPNDPGAISHFQALSAALSATVGLGNIAGVAAAVALGGPGAVFWMWVVGIVGMALKMTEVTQSMLYRNTDDPDNPHGGPMFVISKGFKEIGLPRLGALIGGIFCITLILSAITGGNMFQAWNVAAVTDQYTAGIPRWSIGIVLAIIVALVIIGGIKRIGTVAGTIVPFMCGIYVIAALAVLGANISEVPGMFWMIIEHGLGLQDNAQPVNAFLGGTFAAAFIFGVKRALFSSEAGQGSSPIAHSAAKTKEPVREGVVAGLEPFIDTIVVCTMTALVILSTGAWNREAEAPLPVGLVTVAEDGERLISVQNVARTAITEGDEIKTYTGPILSEDAVSFTMLTADAGDDQDPVRTFQKADIAAVELQEISDEEFERLQGINTDRVNAGSPPLDLEGLDNDAYVLVPDLWSPTAFDAPAQTDDSLNVSGLWLEGHDLFIITEGAQNADQNNKLTRLFANVHVVSQETGDRDIKLSWSPYRSQGPPTVIIDTEATPAGLYGHYVGAQLTAHAFDRAFPGLNLGKWLVITAVWLFAVSTMISWSYYGEQGIVFLFGDSKAAILLYKLMYCVLVFVSTLPFIKTEAELDMWTTLGLGAMLVANIPIMLLFATKSTSAYHEYIDRMKKAS